MDKSSWERYTSVFSELWWISSFAELSVFSFSVFVQLLGGKNAQKYRATAPSRVTKGGVLTCLATSPVNRNRILQEEEEYINPWGSEMEKKLKQK